MKRSLVFVVVLLFVGCLAVWAEGAPAADPGPAGGGCALPDLAQLSPDQVAVAALGAGFQLSAATSDPSIPACPSTFQCSSIIGCGASMVCSATPIGKCCSTAGAVLCCTNTIFVIRCPCHCVLEDCPHQCSQSEEVSRTCS